MFKFLVVALLMILVYGVDVAVGKLDKISEQLGKQEVAE